VVLSLENTSTNGNDNLNFTTTAPSDIQSDSGAGSSITIDGTDASISAVNNVTGDVTKLEITLTNSQVITDGGSGITFETTGDNLAVNSSVSDPSVDLAVELRDADGNTVAQGVFGDYLAIQT
jgi:hypothetical protein